MPVVPASARLSGVSWWRVGLRRLRRAQLAAARLARWAFEPELAPRYSGARPAYRLAEVRAPMSRLGGHPTLERGKRRNVALAATAIDGLALGDGAAFSFWRSVGPLTAARGFVAGMELASGCAVPAIGGGVCLLSNALYQLAAQCGWRLLERHAHSAAVADVTALDATVAFPHVDLRFAATQPAVLSAEVRGDVLVVAAWSDRPASEPVRLEVTTRAIEAASDAPGGSAAAESLPSSASSPIHSASPVAVTVERVIGTRGRGERREVLSREVRRALAADHPTCLSCDQIDCRTGERMRRRAAVARDSSP